MAVSEVPKILVAEQGVLASRSWTVAHSEDGVHVVNLDDDVQEVVWTPASAYGHMAVQARRPPTTQTWILAPAFAAWPSARP